jgi:hypothetical protein
LRLAVPHNTLLAWELRSATAGTRVVQWAHDMLRPLPVGRIAWEAAAAQAGQTLAEWTAAYAARRSSS